MTCKLLQRQIKKYLGDGPYTESQINFFNAVNASYDHFEQDRLMLERSIDISSAEMHALNLSEKKANYELKTLFENIEEIFFSIKFPEYDIVQMSPACENVYGYTINEFINNPKLICDLVHDDDRKSLENADEIIRSGKSCTYEYRIVSKCGQIKWVQTKVKPTLNHNNELVRIDGLTSDITERKRVELKIIESERKFHDLFDKMLDGVYKTTMEGRFIDANPALINILGYDSKEELFEIDIKTQLYVAEKDRDEVLSNKTKDGISTFQLKKKDGSIIWVEDRGQSIEDENGNIIYNEGILRDVSERKNYEEQILKASEDFKMSNERLTEAQEMARIGSWSYMYNTKETICSSEFYKICGLEKIEISNSLEEYLNLIHPEDRNLVCESSIRILVDRKPFKLDWRIILKDNSIKHIHSRVNCLEDENGNILKLYGTIQDISERKNTESELEKNIVELKKSNSELDKFVYSVSHDLCAPLCSMQGVIDIALDDTSDEEIQEYFNMLRGSIKKLDGFITDILDYSRNSRLELKNEAISFKELIGDVTNNLKFMGAGNRKVDINIEINENAIVKSDKSRLSIIFNNLISNAIRYQNSQVPNPFVDIKIDTSDTETGIIIKDNGIGINKDLHQKIFDMFFRVSEESVGSGLGLYIVKEAVEKLDGKILLLSEPGAGSTFQITIPNN